MDPFIVGLDVGYSNLKVAWGTAHAKPYTHIAPAAGGPVEQLSERLGQDGAAVDGGARVWIGGKPWIVGVEPRRIEGFVRTMHADYPQTEIYRALCFAALQVAGRDRVDVLVTGLPVTEYRLQRANGFPKLQWLVGTHRITPHKSIEIARILVLPQPAGAYMDMLSVPQGAMLDVLEHGRTIVIDPGYYSVDWLICEAGNIHRASSDSSLKSVQAVLQTVRAQMIERLGAAPTEEHLDETLRSGQENILLAGRWVSLTPYLQEAGRIVASAMLTELRSRMRGDATAVDAVLLTGGGASLYEPTIRESFPSARLVVSASAPLANARGFWFSGDC